MRTSLGRIESYTILTFISIIILIFLLPAAFSIPQWSQNSTTPSLPTWYDAETDINYSFRITWTDSIGGTGIISNVTFESNFSTVPRNYTIGVNITGSNNTQGIWWVNLTDLPAMNFTYRWYAKNTTDIDYTNSSNQLTYTIQKYPDLWGVGGSSNNISAGAKYPFVSNITYNENNRGDSDCVHMLWRNSTNIINGSTVNDIAILPAGTTVYEYNRTECQNYTAASSGTASYSIGKGAHRISILLNSSSSNQTYEKGSIANITIVSNATIDNITANMTIYTNFTGSNQSVSSLSGSILNSLYNLTDTSSLALGTYIISANASETANYSSSSNSSLILTVIDSTPPTIRLYDYTNATFKKSGNSLNLNISVSDNSVLNANCTVRISNSSSATNISGVTNAKSGWCNGTITVPSDIGGDGNKTINITFYDGNNTGVNSSFAVQLDNVAPAILIYNFSNASSKKPRDTINLNMSASDISGVTGNCYVYVNETNATVNGISYSSGWCNGTITVPSASTFPADGNYTLKVNASDVSGNIGINSSFVIYIDRTAPSVGISISPTTPYVGDTIQISASASDASGIASQSVTITKPNGASAGVGGTYVPDQGGTHTAAITATDNSGNSASASVTFTVYQTSGSLPPSSLSSSAKTSTFTRILPGEAKTMAVDGNIGIIQIEVSVKSTADDITITVKKLDKKPDYVTAIPDKLYRYFELSHQNIQDKIEKVKIKFKVEKSWINTNNIDESTIILNRYSGSQWNKLPTTKLSGDANYTYLEAESPGLSIFAVSGEEKIILVPKEKPAENMTIQEEEKLPEKTEEVEEKPKVSFLIYVISIVVIVLLMIVFFVIKKLKRKRKSE